MKAIKEKIKIVGWAILITGLLTGAVFAQDPSEGLVPTVRVLYPNLSMEQANRVPTSVSVGVLGADLGFGLRPAGQVPLPPGFRPVRYFAQW